MVCSIRYTASMFSNVRQKSYGRLWFHTALLAFCQSSMTRDIASHSSGVCIVFWVLIKWRPFSHLQHGSDFSKGNSTFLFVLSCFVESTIRIRNWDHRGAQSKQGGSEMGHTCGTWAQKYCSPTTGKCNRES